MSQSVSPIGNTLKEARAKKSVSLEEVHSKIKIHPRVLQILEEGKFDKLPSPLFVKSFLKSYADFLEINAEDLLRAYEKEGLREPEQVLFLRSAAERDQKKSSDKNVLAAPVLIGALVLAAAGLFYGIKTVAHLLPKPKKISFNLASNAKSKKLASQEPQAQAPAAAENTDKLLRSPAQGNFPKIGESTPLQLKIKALDSVWLRVTADGKVMFQSILKRGTYEKWVANDKIEIWTGNSKNMSLSLNNYTLGSPGKGVVKKLVIERNGVSIP